MAFFNIFEGKRKIIPKDDIEEFLVTSDIDYEIVEELIKNLPDEVERGRLENELLRYFRGESYYDRLELKEIDAKPLVEIIVGINGAGKTTTIGKLANMYKKSGKKVLLGAGDTFRAAAIEQLTEWSKKLGVDIVSTKMGHDPSAVAFDSIKAGLARDVDNIIIDTAGRLHNKENLKKELEKMVSICGKAMEGAPHRKYLILDGTQGSSTIAQAKVFNELLDIDAIIVTKLDGTSKGGSIFTIMHELKIPIAFIGKGEKEDDLIKFDTESYVKMLLDALYE